MYWFYLIITGAVLRTFQKIIKRSVCFRGARTVHAAFSVGNKNHIEPNAIPDGTSENTKNRKIARQQSKSNVTEI